MCLENPLGAGGKPPEFLRGAQGTVNQLAAAIGAEAAEFSLRAILAEGAFEGADRRARPVGGEIAVAAFTVRTQGKHGASEDGSRRMI